MTGTRPEVSTVVESLTLTPTWEAQVWRTAGLKADTDRTRADAVIVLERADQFHSEAFRHVLQDIASTMKPEARLVVACCDEFEREIDEQEVQKLARQHRPTPRLGLGMRARTPEEFATKIEEVGVILRAYAPTSDLPSAGEHLRSGRLL